MQDVCRQDLVRRFSSVQSLSRVQLFATSWTTAHQGSLSITNSQSLPKIMSIKSVMPSNHLILCHPLLCLPSIFSSIRVLSSESALRIRWLNSARVIHHTVKCMPVMMNAGCLHPPMIDLQQIKANILNPLNSHLLPYTHSLVMLRALC